ncbi:MAG TPA: transposase [Fluviicoccus sp.]|nr:transposase [Fluviicoccus sp.]
MDHDERPRQNAHRTIKTLAKLHILRKRVIRLHLAGEPVMKIVSKTGLSWPAVRKALDLYEHGGMAALKPCDRGRPPGSGRRLTDRQEDIIRTLIWRYRPDEIWMKSALWNRMTVIELVERVTGITFSVRGMNNYLQRWGYVIQNPFEPRKEPCSEAMCQWWHEAFPELERLAHAEGAEIHWSFELGLANLRALDYRLTPAGPLPETRSGAESAGRRLMMATVNRQGQSRWMVADEALNAALLIRFLEALIRDVPKKVYLILNNQPVHRSKPVRDWVAAHPDRIAMFYLPLHPLRNSGRVASVEESAPEFYEVVLRAAGAG